MAWTTARIMRCVRCLSQQNGELQAYVTRRDYTFYVNMGVYTQQHGN